MSGTALELAVGTILEKEIFDKPNEKFASSRSILDSNIQGLVLDARVIFKEMLHEKSPFQVRLGGKKIVATANLRRIARAISTELWREYQAAAQSSTLTVFHGSIHKRPTGFSDPSTRTVLFDKSNKVMYVSTGKNTFTVLRDELTKRVKDNLRQRSPDDVTRIFMLPNPQWVDTVNNLVGNLVREEGINVTIGDNGKELWDGVLKTKHPRYRAIDNKRTRRLKQLREQNLDYEGAQLGHSFGAFLAAAALFFQNVHDLAHKGVDGLQVIDSVPASLQGEIVDILKDAEEKDATYKWERIFGKGLAHAEFTLLFPQDAMGNQVAGGSLGDIGRRLNNFANAVERQVGWVNLAGSPSFKDGVFDDLIKTFLTGKVPRKRKYETKGTHRIKGKSGTIPVTKISGSRSTTRPIKSEKESSPNVDLNALIDYLNTKLHDKIQDNMGKGRSKQILNYRTGTFAKNAKIETFFPVQEKNAIGAKVKYMKKPYGVFEPDGDPRMYKPGRDPHRIFGRSIRQLLQEEKIATLRRVKVDLSG